jgi:hypothetical protein
VQDPPQKGNNAIDRIPEFFITLKKSSILKARVIPNLPVYCELYGLKYNK